MSEQERPRNWMRQAAKEGRLNDIPERFREQLKDLAPKQKGVVEPRWVSAVADIEEVKDDD